MLLNRDRAIKAMNDKKIDALIASTSINIHYLTDVPGIGGYAVLPCDKSISPFVITAILNNPTVITSGTWVEDVRFRGPAFYWEDDPYAELTDLEKKVKANVDAAIMDVVVPLPYAVGVAGMMEELIDGLRERGLDKGTLGIEEQGTTISQFTELKRAIPKAKLVFADTAFAFARQVKTPHEQELIKEAVKIIDEGIKAACAIAQPGVSEGELVKEYKRSLVSYGIEGAGVHYTMPISIGRRTIMPKGGTGMDRSVKLEKGDLITFNPGTVYKHHPAHHGRTAVLGEPKHPKVNAYYQAILDAENSGLEALKPGVTGAEIYDIMMKTARKTIPNYRRNHTGHALSLELTNYDTPNFMAEDHTPLEEGMVFNIEPNFFEFGLGGLRLEDTLVITKNGYQLFTTTSRDIWRL